MNFFLILTLFSSSLFAQEVSEFYYHGVTIGSSKEQALKRLPDNYVSYEKDYPDASCYYIAPKDHHTGVQFLLLDGKVASIHILPSEPKHTLTIVGLGIGSTKSDILTVFSSMQSKHHAFGDGEYLSVKFSNGKGLLFETTAKGIVTFFRFAKHSALFLKEDCS